MDETFSFLPEFLIRHRIWFRSAKFCATFPPGGRLCGTGGLWGGRPTEYMVM